MKECVELHLFRGRSQHLAVVIAFLLLSMPNTFAVILFSGSIVIIQSESMHQ